MECSEDHPSDEQHVRPQGSGLGGMMADTYSQLRPIDAHFHARHPYDERFGFVQHLALVCRAAVFMPNLKDRPILTGDDVDWYWRAILAVANGNHDFHPIMVMKATHDMTPDHLHRGIVEGAAALKFYPVDASCGEGLTTNASGGVHDFMAPEIQELYHVAIAEGIPVLLHGEVPDMNVPPPDREWAFRSILESIVGAFPDLRLVFEHISDRRMLDVIRGMPDHVKATITLHHLLKNNAANANPHNRCMPIIKSEDDRLALLDAALSADPKWMFGSYHAPHSVQAKEAPEAGKGPANGVASALTMMEFLIELFESHGALDRLEAFTRTHAADFYRISSPGGERDRVTYVRQRWTVPDLAHGVRPFEAGSIVEWQLAV